jgi:hypothetical protein
MLNSFELGQPPTIVRAKGYMQRCVCAPLDESHQNHSVGHCGEELV